MKSSLMKTASIAAMATVLLGGLGEMFSGAALAAGRWLGRSPAKRMRKGSHGKSNPAGAALGRRDAHNAKRERFMRQSPSWDDPNALVARVAGAANLLSHTNAPSAKGVNGNNGGTINKRLRRQFFHGPLDQRSDVVAEAARRGVIL